MQHTVFCTCAMVCLLPVSIVEMECMMNTSTHSGDHSFNNLLGHLLESCIKKGTHAQWYYNEDLVSRGVLTKSLNNVSFNLCHSLMAYKASAYSALHVHLVYL